MGAPGSPVFPHAPRTSDRALRRDCETLCIPSSSRRRRTFGWSPMGKEEIVEGSTWVAELRLREFVVDVFRRLGVPARDARTTSDALVAADLRGIGSHGVARLPRYVSGIKAGSIVPRDASRIVKQTRATVLIDGGNGLGPGVGRKAMELAIRKARETAGGFATVRNSNHYGIAGYYSMMAFRAGVIGISSTNPAPLVVPTFSGHKGYGLALLVDILCGALPGAGTALDVYADERAANVGHFFGAIDVRAFRPLPAFKRDMDKLLRTLRESPRAEGHDHIYVHGEKSFAMERERRGQRVPLGPNGGHFVRKNVAD